jgi:hypothetical protein
MSEIHYFPRYSSKENAVTNNTLLLLLRLYQYNRYKFEKLMEILGAEQEVPLPSFGLQFNQQTGTGKSVLDGFLWQESIKIAVETKLGTAFGIEQLKNHLAAFKGEQHKFLILLNPSSESRLDSTIAAIRAHATADNIQVIHATFTDIVKVARKCLSGHDEEMHALVDDYESFCSDSGLLPRDQYTIFVPPCGKSLDENVQHRLYYCPITRSIRNTKYLGVYAKKTIQAIGKITKVVACDVDLGKKTVKEHKDQQKLTENEKQRILGASKAAEDHGWDLSWDHRFFLCDEMFKTDFLKASPGSMMGRRYIDIQDILGDQKIPDDLGDLATLLRKYKWK